MMSLPSFQALYLLFPIVLGVHNLDEYTQAKRLPVPPQPSLYSRHFHSDVARIAMILLTVASAVVAVLNYATHSEALTTVAELSVFALLFNAVGHILLSAKNRARTPGTRSAALLVLPYAIAALTVVVRGSGHTVLALWPLAVGGLIALPAVILIALTAAKGAHKLISRN